MESYLSNKALEELLLEEELQKEILLENKLHDVSMAHLLAYGTPYVPTFVLQTPQQTQAKIMSVKRKAESV